jgi:two-component system, sensor histidine kinase
MNVIIGLSRLLEKTQLDKKQSSYLMALKKSSEGLLILINDILDFSKIESEKLNLEKINFSLNDLFKQLFQAIKYKAIEKKLNLTYFIDPKINDWFCGDPYRLNQILLNLTNNAIKFTDEGNIKVECNLVQNLNKKQRIRFSVSDTGIGISKENLELIFESFTQEDNSISRKFGGTGLGLAITKKLVNVHGGNISVKSNKGQGSTFEFEIEIEEGVEQSNDLTTNTQNNILILKGVKILLVEDNEMNQLLAKTIIQDWGSYVEVANNGIEAINKLKGQQYDLILMDLQMPQMGGFEATKIIRDELEIETPIIALTANALKDDEMKCLEAGMNDYISKPFKEEDLYRKIKKLTGIKSTSSNNDNVLAKQELMPLTDSNLFSLEKLRVIAKGNEEFVKKMTKLFLETTPVNLQKMKTAVNATDFDTVKLVAHSMKPSFDMFDIQSVHVTIRNIEDNAGNRKNLETLEPSIMQVTTIIERVIEQLKKL